MHLSVENRLVGAAIHTGARSGVYVVKLTFNYGGLQEWLRKVFRKKAN